MNPNDLFDSSFINNQTEKISEELDLLEASLKEQEKKLKELADKVMDDFNKKLLPKEFMEHMLRESYEQIEESKKLYETINKLREEIKIIKDSL